MNMLNKAQLQSYFDEETGEKLSLWFGTHTFVIEKICVHVTNVPLLRNPLI